ncbi:cache domain-containing sensor histidine kinase [Robinsoniella sp. KNHs210]|uniref:cache domain-containing sensor histidine kinase n=1 Tax=Robinsoniella sp. KNHs210 TaxID=1469950 RepID=UPI000481D9D2|nr:sensor histidine kinase [Robinsoniella sp. KNHs210]
MKKSIQSNLFLSYSKLIVILILILVTFFYAYISNSLKENASNALVDKCDNLTTQIDTQLERLNNYSKRIAVSKPIKSLLKQDMYSFTRESAQKKLDFSDMVFSALDYRIDNISINIFDFDGHYINMSKSSTFKTIPPEKVKNLTWISDVMDAKGNKILLEPHPDDWGFENEPVISLCRSFSEKNTLPHNTILELQQPFSVIQKIIDKTLSNKTESYNLYILDENGHIVYAYEKTGHNNHNGSISEYWKSITVRESANGLLQGNTAEAGNTYCAYRTSAQFGWTFLVETSRDVLLKPINQFRNIIFLTLVAILLTTLLISYQISRSLVIPLRKLQEITTRLDLKTISKDTVPDYSSQYDELNQLYHSFQSMNKKLEDSLDEVVSLRSHEIQAKMLALQSQMNPHFLYNTLSTISILAEEDCTKEIIDVCDDLSSILRYISSSSMQKVILIQEIDQSIAYMNLMKIKFEDRLIFHIDIDDSMYHIRIPKLIIQPLLENCIKYAIHVIPPWVIHIEGTTKENTWYIKVTDNGSGFNPEKLEALENTLASIIPEKSLPELEIDGMGLINLYIRLKLAYRENAVFKIKNLPGGGTEVTIGGIISEDKNYGDK